MKFALNGALTIGTLMEPMSKFVKKSEMTTYSSLAKQLTKYKASKTKGYDPYIYYSGDEELKSVIDWLSSDYFSPNEGNVLSDLSRVFLVG